MASISTPFELALRHELEGEYVRMANEWFFRWQNLNIEGHVVDVENFFGGRFHTGGIRFEGTIRDSYWHSIQKYLADKTHSIFVRWGVETKVYPAELRETSLEGIALDLRGFTRRIIEHAVNTDRRLRGRGFPERVEPYDATGLHSNSNAKIERLRAAHMLLLTGADGVEEMESSGIAPASNRVVRLDHNSAAYLEAEARLTEMVAAVQSNNEYAVTEPEDWEQSVAELESGQRLLKAPQVRLDAITSVLVKGLTKLVAKFGDALLGALAALALTALAALLGIPLPSL
jgi:hypothetical protein